MLVRLVLSWASNVAAIFVASVFLDGVDYADDWGTLLLAGLVFGFVNWLVRPVVVVLALPIVILTLGVALFLVNMLMLYLTTWIVPDFEIDTFWSAVFGTLIVWAVNVVLNGVAGRIEAPRRHRHA